ncbi:MAG: hypothetical protein Tsb0034_25150 [Ekhidna sp.]
MHYESFFPSDPLKELVKEFWIYENDDPEVDEQKIIPDGYSEIIFHYGDPFQINLNGIWEDQSRLLFSSQITKYFYLRNTGRSGMLGIKLFPTALHRLLQMDLSETVDCVLPLESTQLDVNSLAVLADSQLKTENKVKEAEAWLTHLLSNTRDTPRIDECVSQIMLENGMADIEQLASSVGLSTRQLERSFKKVVGLTPKFYSRIVRFNYIFEVMKEHNDSWIRIALQSGYFDQSHFIKNFKEFTGEEPSSYGFSDDTLANFFLRK